MLDEEVPRYIRVGVVIQSEHLGADIKRSVRSSLDQQNGVSSKSEIGGDCTASWTATGDDIVVSVGSVGRSLWWNAGSMVERGC